MVHGLGFRGLVFKFRVEGLVPMVHGSGFRVSTLKVPAIIRTRRLWLATLSEQGFLSCRSGVGKQGAYLWFRHRRLGQALTIPLSIFFWVDVLTISISTGFMRKPRKVLRELFRPHS